MTGKSKRWKISTTTIRADRHDIGFTIPDRVLPIAATAAQVLIAHRGAILHIHSAHDSQFLSGTSGKVAPGNKRLRNIRYPGPLDALSLRSRQD